MQRRGYAMTLAESCGRHRCDQPAGPGHRPAPGGGRRRGGGDRTPRPPRWRRSGSAAGRKSDVHGEAARPHGSRGGRGVLRAGRSAARPTDILVNGTACAWRHVPGDDLRGLAEDIRRNALTATSTAAAAAGNGPAKWGADRQYRLHRGRGLQPPSPPTRRQRAIHSLTKGEACDSARTASRQRDGAGRHRISVHLDQRIARGAASARAIPMDGSGRRTTALAAVAKLSGRIWATSTGQIFLTVDGGFLSAGRDRAVSPAGSWPQEPQPRPARQAMTEETRSRSTTPLWRACHGRQTQPDTTILRCCRWSTRTRQVPGRVHKYW